MTVLWVDATKQEITDVAEQLAEQETAWGNSIPTGIAGETQFTSFTESLGVQPTPLEYMAFIAILLERGGYDGAHSIINKQFNWLLMCFGQGVEPLPVADFLFTGTDGKCPQRTPPASVQATLPLLGVESQLEED